MERRLVDGGGLKKMRKSDRCGSDCGRVRDCEKDSEELVEKVSYRCVYPLKNEVSPLKYPPKSTPLPLTSQSTLVNNFTGNITRNMAIWGSPLILMAV
jgi:hypothetical protein